jgi:hypothetical protein
MTRLNFVESIATIIAAVVAILGLIVTIYFQLDDDPPPPPPKTLDIRATHLDFYESSNPGLKEPRGVPASFFDARTVRYIYCSLRLEHQGLPENEESPIKITAKYYQDEELFDEQTLDISVNSDSSWHFFGRDKSSGRDWPVGTYRVKIYTVGTDPIIEDSFTVKLGHVVATHLDFYASSEPLEEPRGVSGSRFDARTTRYICCSLRLEHQGLPKNEAFPIKITAKYYKDKKLYDERTLDISVDSDSSRHFFSHRKNRLSRGKSSGENWEVGSYQVKIYIEKKDVGQEPFTFTVN